MAVKPDIDKLLPLVKRNFDLQNCHKILSVDSKDNIVPETQTCLTAINSIAKN